MFLSDKTWEQWWFIEYSSEAKLMYLYFCSKSNIFGIGRHSLKKVCFEVDLSAEKISSALNELDNEIITVFEKDRVFWSYIKGFFAHNSGNTKGEFESNTKSLKNPRQLKGFKSFYDKSKFPNDLKSILQKDFQKVLKTTLMPQTIPLSRKEVIVIRDKFRCVYCNKEYSTSNEIGLDHLHPKAKGGDDSWENLVASCKTCNREKSDLTLKDKEKFKPNPNYRKFEAIEELKKPDVFTKYRQIFSSGINEYILNESSNNKDSSPTKIKRKPIYDIICEILENSTVPLDINQIQKIIKDDKLFLTRENEIPSTGRLSAYISQNNKKYDRIKTEREGHKYLYSLK